MGRGSSLFLAGAIAFQACLLIASTAIADTKVFPASSCAILSGPGTRTASGIITNASIVNSTLISCPLTRDHPTLKATRIEVSVVDNSSPATGVKDITCRGVTTNRFGGNSSVGPGRSTSGTNSAGTILNLVVPLDTNANGSLLVTCTIPRRGTNDPNSYVASIMLVEPDAPD